MAAQAVIHGNRGRQPQHTIDAQSRRQVMRLARDTYSALNDSHLTEVLAEVERIRLSRSSVRRIRQEVGLASPRTRRELVHRMRRARRVQTGQLVQVDGSHHRWFGPDHPQAVLLAAIDDATSSVVAAHFTEREGSLGYLKLYGLGMIVPRILRAMAATWKEAAMAGRIQQNVWRESADELYARYCA